MIEENAIDLSIENGRIIIAKLKKNSVLTLQEMDKFYIQANKLTVGKKVVMLFDGALPFIDNTKIYKLNTKVDSLPNRIATAFVTDVFQHPDIWENYLHFAKPKHPVRIFSSKDEAINWLKKFTDKNYTNWIITKSLECCLLKPNLIYISAIEGGQIDIEEIKHIIEACKKLTKNKPFKIITDLNANFNITIEAKEFAGEKIKKTLIIAGAIITKNVASRLLVTFFTNFYKTNIPTKFFSTYKEANNWLNKF